MNRTTVDLASYINRTVERGHQADFPVALMPLFRSVDGSFHEVSHWLAAVREDTSDTLAVVSDRYTLVPHDRILDLVQEAVAPLDVGPVPRNIYVKRYRARMRAVSKFPVLARSVFRNDDICACLKIQNTHNTHYKSPSRS